MRFREPTSSLSHFFAAALTLLGWGVLVLAAWGDPLKLIVMTVYSLSCAALYLASGVYHMVDSDPATLARLVKYDRVTIFLQIAGTYTPFCVYFLTGNWRITMLVLLWGIALVGSLYVILFYVRGVSRRIYSTLAYVAMGGAGVIAAPQVVGNVPPEAISLIVLGGAFYLIGAVVYSLNRPVLHPRYFNAHDIWHIFTMLGGGSYYVAILAYVV
jgi:hemolysin III